jgi:hypothetical protein
MELKTGDVILFHTKFKITKPLTWIPVFIRLCLNTRYNHVGVIISNWGKLFLNEADEKGIVAVPIEERLKNKEYVVLRCIHPIIERDFAIKANSYLGSKYDFLSLFVYYPIYLLTGKWIEPTRSRNDQRKLFCSEYVALLYDIPNWWKVNPKDILYHKFFYKVEIH